MKFPELDRLFCDLLASNRGPGYGLSVLAATPDHSVLTVELRFLAGRLYCCVEPGCHLPSNCDKLKQLASARSIPMPENVLVRWHCVVEEGARLECLARVGLPHESNSYEYDAVSPAAVDECSMA